MRYVLMFSLAALFLIACGDTDNPVVTTAPAGKTTVNLSEEECQAATSLPESFLEQARELNPELDEDLLLSTWKANGCDDAVLWGLSWMVTNDAEVTFEVVIYTPPPEDDPKTAAHTKGTGNANIHTQSEINRHGYGSQIPYTSSDAGNRNLVRFDNLRADGVLPTVSVRGCLEQRPTPDPNNPGTTVLAFYAAFIFTRNGPTDESLTFSFSATTQAGSNNEQSSKVTSGFGAGNDISRWETALSGANPVRVELIEGWTNDMTGDFQLGTAAATVNWGTYYCN